MARMDIELSTEEFDIPLEKVEPACKAGVYAGAGAVADALRAEIEALPEDDRWWYIPNIESNKINVISRTLKKEMLEALNTTSIELDANGYISNYVGIYDGYSSIITEKYKKGLPIQMIANSIEAGSSVRRKYPICRKATAAVTPKAQSDMESAISKVLEE